MSSDEPRMRHGYNAYEKNSLGDEPSHALWFKRMKTSPIQMMVSMMKHPDPSPQWVHLVGAMRSRKRNRCMKRSVPPSPSQTTNYGDSTTN
jgi:hypothetical protein